MTVIIKDGTGQGNAAKVSADNHLAVNAVNVEELTHISSLNQKAYTVQFERTMAAGDTFENVGYLQYSGDAKLQISTITTSREDVNLSGGSQAVIVISSGVDYTSGGATVTPTNLNTTSSNQPDHTAYTGTTTLVLDTSNESILAEMAVENAVVFDVRGSLILNKGAKIALRARSKNIGDKVLVNLIMFEVTEAI